MMLAKAPAFLVAAMAARASAQSGDAGAASSLVARATAPEVEHHLGNPCKHEPDGWRCHDDVAIQCGGGRTVSHEACSFHQECKVGRSGPGIASCVEDACEDKADGFHCHQDHVVQCSGLAPVGSTQCAFYQDCERDRAQLNAASCVEDVCERKADGRYCEDGHVVECQGFKTVSATECGATEECKKNALGWNMAACLEADCRGKADGQYCKHDGVVECRGQAAVSFSKCAFYQECAHGWQMGARVASCAEDACEDKVDGWHCKGNHLVQCSGLVTVDIQVCPSYQECEQSSGVPAACV